MGRRLARFAGALLLGFAMVLTGIAPASAAPPAGATVVGAANTTACPNPSFSTIQAAVTAASPGDTIYVCPGTYPENVSVTKNVTLLGPQYQTPATATNRTNAERGGDHLAPRPATRSATAVRARRGRSAASPSPARGEGILALTGGSGYTWTNNVITGEATGIHLTASDTTITGNRFGSETSPTTGTGGIFLSNGASNNLTITDNAFTGNATDINTTGPGVAGTLSSGLVVSNNTSDGDGNFIALFLTAGAKITDNTVTGSTSSALFVGGGNTGATITGNTISGGDATGINVVAQFYVGSPNQVSEIASNTITGRSNGIRIQPDTEQSSSTRIADNVVRNSSNNGIWLESGTGITVTGNRSLDSGAKRLCGHDHRLRNRGHGQHLDRRHRAHQRPGQACARRSSRRSRPATPPNGTVGKHYRFTVTATGSPKICLRRVSRQPAAGSVPRSGDNRRARPRRPELTRSRSPPATSSALTPRATP